METNNIQTTADAFFQGFEENSGRVLLFRDDLQKLIAHSFATQKLEQLHEITFAAKYINGMKRVLHSAANNPEIKNVDEIKKDLSTQIGKTMSLIGKLIEDMEGTDRQQIQSLFLEMNPQSFINLTNLFTDLEQLKVYFNRLKQAGNIELDAD